MKLTEFDYELPSELVAQSPSARRDEARLLVHALATGDTSIGCVAELPRRLRRGDLLVLNDTRVLPARLLGRRDTGGAVEFLFLEPTREGLWRALVRPGKKVKAGEVVSAAEGALRVRLVERSLDEAGAPEPTWEVELASAAGPDAPVEVLLERHGRMPLPPYIERDPSQPAAEADRARYQTVYASTPGAVAAPTAGLHFTPELLVELAQAGVEAASVTLHVGLGTFLPVTVEEVEQHRMHSERYHLGPQTVAAVEVCRARGGRVVAVGTTSLRVLESCAAVDGRLRAGSGRTDIFIRPGYEFRAVDGLLTNFHLPKSTLLMLVSAFAGLERTRELYRRAIAESLRFYSYGDAMLLLP